MRPSGLVAVLNDVWLQGRRRVVELGGGVSTVFLARLLADLHGCDRPSLVSVEHDDAWVVRITDQLGREGLSGVARVVHAPLGAHALSWDDAGWYDEGELRAAIEGAYGHDRVDLLVVDGPPASLPGTEHSRYPALGVLSDRLKPGATIVLDDIQRLGERRVLDRWAREYGIVPVVRVEAEIAVATWPNGTN